MAVAAQISEHLESGDIGGAVASALTQVKEQPTNTDARRMLIDLLIVAGDFERADKQADILSKTAMDLTLAMSLLRGRLRAAAARAAWFSEGAVPAFPEGPTPRDEAAMKLGIALREKDEAAAAAALAELTALTEEIPLVVNDKPVAAFRDADDRVPHALEILCTDGSYMWVDFGLIENVSFPPSKAVRDLAWRPAKLTLHDGSESDVTVCGTYYAADETDAHKLARHTDWLELPGGAVAGQGQKAFLAGDDVLYAQDLTRLAGA